MKARLITRCGCSKETEVNEGIQFVKIRIAPDKVVSFGELIDPEALPSFLTRVFEWRKISEDGVMEFYEVRNEAS